MTQTNFESTTIQMHRVSLPSSEDDQTLQIVEEQKMFAESLHHMISNLTEMKPPLVAEWCNNGSLFVIHNRMTLEPILHDWFGKNVVPTCETFLSLLNEYGFTKLNVEGSSIRGIGSHNEGEEDQHAPDKDLKFWHPCFHRDDKTSLRLIQRQVLQKNKVEFLKSEDDSRSKSNCAAVSKVIGKKTKRSRQVEDCKNNTQEGHSKKKSRTSIDRLRESVRSLRRSIEMLETAAHESLNGLQTKYDQLLHNEFNVMSPTTQHSIPSAVCAQENKWMCKSLSPNDHGFAAFPDLEADEQQHAMTKANNADDWSCHSGFTLDPIKFSFDDWA